MSYPSSHEEIERQAYRSWEARGRPFGSPEVDWYAAERELAVLEPGGVLVGWRARSDRPSAARSCF